MLWNISVTMSEKKPNITNLPFHLSVTPVKGPKLWASVDSPFMMGISDAYMKSWTAPHKEHQSIRGWVEQLLHYCQSCCLLCHKGPHCAQHCLQQHQTAHISIVAPTVTVLQVWLWSKNIHLKTSCMKKIKTSKKMRAAWLAILRAAQEQSCSSVES